MIGIGRAGPTGSASQLARSNHRREGDRAPRPEERHSDGGPSVGTPGGTREERDAWAILATVQGLGPLSFGRLIATHGSALAVLDAALVGDPMIEVRRRPGREARPAARKLGRVRLSHAAGRARPRASADGPAAAIRAAIADAGRLAETIERLRLEVVPIIDPRYPSRLRAIDLPPPVLFVQGDPAILDAATMVAVVGTRRPTDRGRRTAAEIAAALSDAGVAVTSGLAIGIDGVAHAAVLGRRGRTIAVLGSGHANLYPTVHRRLAREIDEHGGALVSELPPDTRPSRGTFPRRNRLISGLTDATIVVEAGDRSGALITAGWALEQGRECFVVPGAVGDPASQGCLRLLRDCHGQVRVVAGIRELIEDLGLDPAALTRSSPPEVDRERSPALGRLESTIACTLVDGGRTADELVMITGEPIAAVLAALTMLEARGLVVGVYGRYQATPRLLGSPPAG